MRYFTILAAVLAVFAATPIAAHDPADQPRWSIAIHGGAGTMDRDKMTEQQQAAYKAALQSALDAGIAVLEEGGTAMDAVKAAIIPMEDDPKFNAGKGAVYTWEGVNELDAALMDGASRKAGAITGVRRVKNPILLAEAVMQDGRHVFLSGEGAEEFAADAGIELVEPAWFETEHRRKALERMKAEKLSAMDVDHKFGTVGAVVLDTRGNLAAGTSTGGLTGKRWGRIGDAPIIGAGTYADNRSCAVSATGAGEYFIRAGVAQEICTRLRLTGQMALDDFGGSDADGQAARVGLTGEIIQSVADAVMAEVKDLGGDGGVIIVSPEGEAIFSFNTQGMYRGRATSGGLNEVAIFDDE
ncbi:isoaspartyl peptidase/L-asparaginase family protein [Pontixanthobacter luteolus]|uniref:isoaspartyl peptidase/L-asparaginase family protein n=1 Tax=Pontixanthobacter luteolus TaxID=295089 RepID=UPI002302BCC2|nr:isoaspartyl peptidase/L-asparaginase [Pontixanthobacter luteolus]